MKFSEYNSFPEDMEEMTPESWQDFFTYCIEGIESRQAYKESFQEMGTALRILWIKKEKGLGMCISREYNPNSPEIKFFRVGKQEEWDKLKCAMAAMFAHDNS